LITPAVKHQTSFLLEVGFRPMINTPSLRQNDFAVLVFARDPVRVFRREIRVVRVKNIDEPVPAAPHILIFIDVNKVAEIMTEPQPHPDFAHCLVPFEDELGEQRGRTVLDGQCVREAKVVLGDDVRVDQSHQDSPIRSISDRASQFQSTFAEILR
jgi:hypothetical protein